jgi:hypothetical protein
MSMNTTGVMASMTKPPRPLVVVQSVRRFGRPHA